MLPIGREVYKHIASARKDYTGKTEDAIRKGLYEPLFRQLGFAFTPQKSASSSVETADYLLYEPGKTDTPIAAALTYVWNRNLDDVDPTRDEDTAIRNSWRDRGQLAGSGGRDAIYGVRTMGHCDKWQTVAAVFRALRATRRPITTRLTLKKRYSPRKRTS